MARICAGVANWAAVKNGAALTAWTHATFELTVTNPGGHSSTPRADNAIYDVAAVLKRLEAHRFPVKVDETTRGYLRAMARLTPGPEGEAMGRLAENPADVAGRQVQSMEHRPVPG